MVTLRYHFLTIAAIFLSLGIGIMLGGSMGQNWMNEKQQIILGNLEQKYNQALQSNKELQQQLNALNRQVQTANRDVSRFVSSDYVLDLQGKKIALWHHPEVNTDPLKQLLSKVGLKIVEVGGMEHLGEDEELPVIFVGEKMPDWSTQIEKKIHLRETTIPPIDQWELFRGIQSLIKEKQHEY